MPVMTAEEACQWIPGLSDPDTDTAALLDAVIARADSMVATELGYTGATDADTETVLETDYERFFAGPGGRELQLPYYPIVVADPGDLLIEDDPNEAFDGTSYLVPSSDYVLRPGGIVLLTVASSWGTWSETDDEVIRVRWTAGYAEGAIPGRLFEGLGTMVGVLWARRSSIGKDSVSIGQRQTIMPRKPRSIPDEVLDLIAPYRLVGALL